MLPRQFPHIAASTLLAWLVAICATSAGAADPVTVDRVVAIVDQEPILLSDVARRVEAVAPRQGGTPLEASDQRRLAQKVIEQLVEEALIRREAAHRAIDVTEAEIDRAVSAVAQQNGLSEEAIYAEAAKSGLDRSRYRQELLRSLQEHKLLQQDVTSKITVSDGDVRTAYEDMVASLRRDRPYRPAWIVVRIPHGASETEVAARKARADEVVQKARTGAAFADLAQQYSDDTATKSRGGDLGERVPQGSQHGMALRPELEEEALRLDVGQTSDPIRLEDAFVVLYMVDRPAVRVPSFDDSRESLWQRVYVQKLSQARDAWVDDLRSKCFVELRFTPSRTEEKKP